MVFPNDGFQRFYRARLRSDESTGRGVIRVQQLALDSLLDILPRVDFVKCDVEGAEMLVLIGGEKLLTTRRPNILLEIQSRPGGFAHEPQDVFDWLGKRGWHSYYLREGRLHPTKGIATDNPGPNYVFLRTC